MNPDFILNMKYSNDHEVFMLCVDCKFYNGVMHFIFIDLLK